MAGELQPVETNWIELQARLDALSPPFAHEIFLMECLVAGTTHVRNVEKRTERLSPGDTLTLLRDPDNEYDPQAIGVFVNGNVRVGWIPQDRNDVISRLMDAGKVVYAKLQSRETTESGWLKMEIGVFLHDI